MVVDYLIIGNILIKDSIKTELMLLYICSQVDLSRQNGTQSVSKNILIKCCILSSQYSPTNIKDLYISYFGNS